MRSLWEEKLKETLNEEEGGWTSMEDSFEKDVDREGEVVGGEEES